jgi:hypothetical protein
MSEIPGQSGHALPTLQPPVCARSRLIKWCAKAARHRLSLPPIPTAAFSPPGWRSPAQETASYRLKHLFDRGRPRSAERQKLTSVTASLLVSLLTSRVTAYPFVPRLRCAGEKGPRAFRLLKGRRCYSALKGGGPFTPSALASSLCVRLNISGVNWKARYPAD